jgi:threonine/homoserine/homoserine lactone efflux protein
MLITSALDHNALLRILVYSVFVLIGILFFFKKPAQNPPRKSKLKLGDYGRGALVGLLNPQAIPFWVFVFTYFQSHHWINNTFLPITIFLIGVTAGKFLALGMFALLGELISRRAGAISGWMNKILGLVFILIGGVQLVKALL